MMEVIVNGANQSLAAGASIQDLLQQLGMTQGRIAVELNAEIVPRSRYQETPLNAGDKVEIVHAIGGG